MRASLDSTSVLYATSDAFSLWLAQPNEPGRQVEFHGVSVSAGCIPPGCQQAENPPSPLWSCVILHGREPAIQHFGEILHPLPHLRRQPRGILMADIVDSSGLCPLLRRGGKRGPLWSIGFEDGDPGA